VGCSREGEVREVRLPAKRRRRRRRRSGPYVARAELVLARRDTQPLGDVGLKPDPLQAFASQFDRVRSDLGETADVVIDVMPATPWQQRRLRRRLMRQARRENGSRGGQRSQGAGIGMELIGAAPAGGGGGRVDVAETMQRRYDLRHLWTKLGEDDPLLQMQILIRATSQIPQRAEANVKALETCFRQFSGQNHFRVVGVRLLGVAFVGSDSWFRRWYFDRRFDSGLFRPARRSIVNAREIAALLKPPTKHCRGQNIVRLGGVIPRAPQSLPTFERQRDLLPLGRVNSDGGSRLVGIPLEDTFFQYFSGRSRYGKTELGLNQFLHLVRSGHGAMFVDPHEDAITRMKTYLTDAEFADRILEINLAGMGDLPQIGWNPLAMAGLGPEHKPAKVRALEDSFAAALHWDQRNTRALNLVTQSAQTLIELAMILPPELAPTIFQITTLLSDEDWRGAVLPFISKTSQSFWTQRFDRLPKDAITPVTNLLDRLRPSPAIAALLGSSDSMYDVRRAMDEGKIVLACPGSGDASDELIANFLVYDLIRAAKTRVDTPPDRRRPFFLFLDELQIYDGAMSGNIAAILEQTAKYGLRAFAFNQDPNRLTDRTLNALLNNRSHLLTTVVSAAGAARLAKEWGGEPTATTITRLQRFTFLAHVTQGLDRPAPFLVQGVAAEEMWADHHHPERVPALDEHITLNTPRRRPTEIAKHLDDLDDRILAALQELSRGRRPGRPPAPPAPASMSSRQRPLPPPASQAIPVDLAAPADANARSVSPAPASAPLLGGVTIKRRRRGAAGDAAAAIDGDARADNVDRDPAAKPAAEPMPAPVTAPTVAAAADVASPVAPAQRTLDDASARPTEPKVDPPPAPTRRLTPMGHTASGGSPLLQSLDEDAARAARRRARDGEDTP
jgi:hypothetical protein